MTPADVIISHGQCLATWLLQQLSNGRAKKIVEIQGLVSVKKKYQYTSTLFCSRVQSWLSSSMILELLNSSQLTFSHPIDASLLAYHSIVFARPAMQLLARAI